MQGSDAQGSLRWEATSVYLEPGAGVPASLGLQRCSLVYGSTKSSEKEEGMQKEFKRPDLSHL